MKILFLHYKINKKEGLFYAQKNRKKLPQRFIMHHFETSSLLNSLDCLYCCSDIIFVGALLKFCLVSGSFHEFPHWNNSSLLSLLHLLVLRSRFYSWLFVYFLSPPRSLLSSPFSLLPSSWSFLSSSSSLLRRSHHIYYTYFLHHPVLPPDDAMWCWYVMTVLFIATNSCQ